MYFLLSSRFYTLHHRLVIKWTEEKEVIISSVISDLPRYKFSAMFYKSILTRLINLLQLLKLLVNLEIYFVYTSWSGILSLWDKYCLINNALIDNVFVVMCPANAR